MDRVARIEQHRRQLDDLRVQQIAAEKRRQGGGAVALVGGLMTLLSLGNPPLATLFFMGAAGGLIIYTSAKSEIDRIYRQADVIERALRSLETY